MWHVNRAKSRIESVHPLHCPELRALRPLQGTGPYVFLTETGTPAPAYLRFALAHGAPQGGAPEIPCDRPSRCARGTWSATLCGVQGEPEVRPAIASSSSLR
jgi:hypothetical protein